ncbi:hypothetical protein [Streptomyces sp. NPDC046332]|uniref:hypothetical protein n=1 Tax=Streptomyces sp. NPDC046332 TaxID=3155133 RepID=UPI00340D120D
MSEAPNLPKSAARRFARTSPTPKPLDRWALSAGCVVDGPYVVGPVGDLHACGGLLRRAGERIGCLPHVGDEPERDGGRGERVGDVVLAVKGQSDVRVAADGEEGERGRAAASRRTTAKSVNVALPAASRRPTAKSVNAALPAASRRPTAKSVNVALPAASSVPSTARMACSNRAHPIGRTMSRRSRPRSANVRRSVTRSARSLPQRRVRLRRDQASP